ncbi:3-oxoacyl-[acyl-carrier-protein] synthase III C-terminal domain-containing protein [Streptomyces fulvorobeus]|uniref:3-oxoacyl-ACP synthase n=1 Tax=Streptomyces fulvorobeus TaxID=284028 RepID=A0A7J0C9D3_9ACTN|nr:3-oxoacyl-[acyl-carrier-protein] synthase III C-terminal domain-containing protein [Streptomyces fulvorobeus]NYE42727.1 3-oxoacyl-[acyl-carrier-protein] synthase-3 [Streptomyces fulvorobeus]GFM99140.1 3-oxoacyl-ACP synthase [Streptomyces fulvorobeus]
MDSCTSAAGTAPLGPPAGPEPFPYEIAGAHADLGTVVAMDDWAERTQVPDRHRPGRHLSGATVTRLLGVRGKSWDPAHFADLGPVVAVARQALDHAGLSPRDITTVVVVTCTPYQVMLDQDAFALMRRLGIPDHVPPVQLGAGCGGMARAAAVVSAMRAERALVVAYNITSRVSTGADGTLLPQYAGNTAHPYGRNMWASPALFSDGAAALVLRREADADGVLLYSRDSLSFDGGPGITDPLIHVLGGGGSHPAGTPGADELSAYGMNSPEIRRYYSTGMALNHEALEYARPGYLKEITRLYTHQAHPFLVDAFLSEADIPAELAPGNARAIGNTAAPSTLALLHADLEAGRLVPGDVVCLSVVGSGPERGAFLAPLAVR